MHTVLDYGINAIERRIGVNKISIRRWLIAAGCYRTGHQTTHNKNDGAKLVAYRPTNLGRKQIYHHVWQRRAWRDEWEGVARWDELKHWTSRSAHFMKSEPNVNNHLEEWLSHPGMDTYIGKTACFKLAVLAAIVSREPQVDVAARYGKTRQAAGKHAANAKRIFGMSTGRLTTKP